MHNSLNIPNISPAELARLSPDEIIRRFGGEDRAKDLLRWCRYHSVVPKQARTDYMTFVKYMHPHPEHFQDADYSSYDAQPHHYLLSDLLTEVLHGKCKRVAISLPPQTGKSTLGTRMFLPYHAGWFPRKHLLMGAYNQDFAEEFGDEVRTVIESEEYRRVFPNVELRQGSKAKDHMVTNQGGKLSFIGREGSGTGRPADGFLLDDLIKNAKEAESRTNRNDIWNFFTRVANTRCHSQSWQVIIMCMTGDTRVMLEDGTEKLLRDIRPGDRVATYKDGELSKSSVKNWTSNGLDSIFEIRMTSGIVVKANARHPFLVFEDGEPKWIQTKNLFRGQEIFRVNGGSGREKLAHGKVATSRCHAEGFVHRTTKKNDGQTGLERHLPILSLAVSRALSTVMELLRMSTIGFLPHRAGSVLYADCRQEAMSERIGAESCVSTIATKQGRSGLCSAMTATLLSGMQKLKKLLWRQQSTSDFILDEIAEITEAGIEEVFDVQIEGTENFIANGLVSHNTRWSDDDLIARLTDPKNPYYRESVARQWTVINIPAIMDSEPIAHALGKKVGDALWPERFPLDLLATAREMDPMGFSALHMGRPTPPEGAFYKQNDIYEYHSPDEFPQNARMYQTGDLAVSTEITADKSAVGTWGLDEHDVLWLHPDLYWERRSSDESVDEIIDRGKQYKIMEAFFEKGQLEKAIGPFLEKRMTEEKAYFTVTPMSVSGNKGMKSLSIRGRMRQGKVRFPAFAPWWPAAKEQLLKFTGSGSDKEDDFCDMVALIGQALDDTIAASKPAGNVIKMPKVGTLAWVKYASDRQKQHEWRMKMRRGM